MQKLIKLRMMEEGIKIMDKPIIPELFEIEPADVQIFTIPILDGYAFTDMEEVKKVAEALQNAKSLRKTDYDWQKLGSDYKYLIKKERYAYRGNSDFDVMSGWVYSKELYAKITDFAVQNKAMKEQAEKDKKEYEQQLQDTSDIVAEIRERVSEVKDKYMRLNTLTRRFAVDYYPLSDNNEEMAIKFMVKAYSLNEEEKTYVLANYKKELTTSCLLYTSPSPRDRG